MGVCKRILSALFFSAQLLFAANAAAADAKLDELLAHLAERTYHEPREVAAKLERIRTTHGPLSVQQQATLLEISSRAARGMDDFAGSLYAARQLESLGKRTQNKTVECLGLLQHAYHYFVIGKVQTAHDYSHRAEQCLLFPVSPTARVKILLTVAQTYDEAQQPEAARRSVAEALQIATISNDIHLQFLALKLQTERAIAASDFEHASANMSRLTGLARQSGYVERLIRAKRTEFRFATAAGLADRARQIMDENIRLIKQARLEELLGFTLVEYSDLHLKSNRFSEAAASAEQALSIKTVLSDAQLAKAAYFNHAIALVRMGKLARGKEEMERLLAPGMHQDDMPEYLQEYVAALTHAGDTDAAVKASALFERTVSSTTVQREKAQEAAQLRIDSLANDNLTRAREALDERGKRNLWQMIAIAAVFVAFAILLVYQRLRIGRRKLIEANSKLYIANTRDFLTGLFNRRHIEKIAEEIARGGALCHESGSRNAGLLFVIDIDHFKKVNDTFGHSAGDKVLKEVAQSLLNVFGNEGLVARWGGEEFVAIVPPACDNDGAGIAARLIQMVSATPVTVGATGLTVTISAGVCSLPLALADRCATWEESLQLADQCLYLAKQKGRNRAYVISDATSTPSEAIASGLSRNAVEGRLALLEVPTRS